MKTYIFLLLSLAFLASCSNAGPLEAPYNQGGARVIGRETCNVDTTKDYWLVDFSYPSLQKQWGDTIVFHGKTYFNVVKTLGLDSQFQAVDKTLALGFNISKEPVTTQGCNVGSPDTYSLKVITIATQGEIP